MTDQDQNSQGGSLGNSKTSKDGAVTPPTKRPFVEPEISDPVDVLEATTFFQSLDSGPTN